MFCAAIHYSAGMSALIQVWLVSFLSVCVWRARAQGTVAAARESLQRDCPCELTSPAFHACGSTSPFRACCCHSSQKQVVSASVVAMRLMRVPAAFHRVYVCHAGSTRAGCAGHVCVQEVSVPHVCCGMSLHVSLLRCPVCMLDANQNLSRCASQLGDWGC